MSDDFVASSQPGQIQCVGRNLAGKIIVTERMRKAAIDKYYSWTSHRYAGDDIFDEEVAEAVFTAMMDASDA